MCLSVYLSLYFILVLCVMLQHVIPVLSEMIANILVITVFMALSVTGSQGAVYALLDGQEISVNSHVHR